MLGNRRMLIHLDAYGVPQSLQWPAPGAPDRIGWRDPFDEWPYWEELPPETIRARMTYFQYPDGNRDYLHDALDADIDYLKETNILKGRYVLPGGATVELLTFVTPDKDVWVRDFRITGKGKLVFQGEFFEKAVRGHSLAHLGNVDFRGGLTAPPRGAYILTGTLPLKATDGHVETPVDGSRSGSVLLCFAADIQSAVQLGQQARERGTKRLECETTAADRSWIARANLVKARHPFVRMHYKRWLLSNRLLLTRDGAMVCGPRPFWSFIWPRDGSQLSAAFARAGYIEEARQSVKWTFDRTPESGIHDARYFSDATPMRLDNRFRQGDNPGFLCWAAGVVCESLWDRDWALSIRDNLYRMAEHLVQDRDPETLLPLPESDHREHQASESIGLVVTAIGGLHAAARIADRLQDHKQAQRYRTRATEIKRGAEQHLWHARERYFMTSIKPISTRSDIAFAWGVYPFEAWTVDDAYAAPAMDRLVRDRWNPEVGGVLAAPGTPYESYWMFHAAKLLLGVAGIGDHTLETEILDSMQRNASPQGMIPEQIGSTTGNIWGCAPLPTAHALLLLYAYRDNGIARATKNR